MLLTIQLTNLQTLNITHNQEKREIQWELLSYFSFIGVNAFNHSVNEFTNLKYHPQPGEERNSVRTLPYSS